MSLPLIIAGIGAAASIGSGLAQNYWMRRQAREAEQRAAELSGEYTRLGIAAGTKATGFGNTEYGQYLQKLSEQGMLSAAEEERILSQVSREAGGIEQEARQRYMGQLAARGLEGSVAGARGMNELASQRMQVVSEARQEISQSELEAQRRAEEVFAQTSTQYQQSYEDVRDQYMLAAMEARHGGQASATASRAAGSQAAIAGLASGTQQFGTALAADIYKGDLNKTLQGMLADYKAAEGNPTLQYQIGMQLKEMASSYYSANPGGAGVTVPRTWR